MKKFADLPVYFIIIGLILNIIMYFYNEVSFTSLMIRSCVFIVLFAAMGYFLAYVLRDAHNALARSKSRNLKSEENEADPTSTIDIRVNAEEDDELFRMIPESENEEFAELNLNNFKRFMDQDRD